MKLAHSIVAEGSSPPIVLLHSLALDRSMWQGLVDSLDTDRAVITMDLRGHGQSPRGSSFTIEDMAGDVAETLASMGHESAVVVGLSMGGCVAQAMAIRHPSSVTGLGLVDTTAWYGADAAERWEERGSKAAEQGMRSLSQFQLDRWFGAEFLETDPEVARSLLEVFASNDLDSYRAACRAMGAFDARDGLADVAAPAVVIVGADDPATTPAQASDIHERLPNSTLHVLAGAKHLTPVERPQDVADLLAPLWK